MKRSLPLLLLFALILAATPLGADEALTLTRDNQGLYTGLKKIILRSAQDMPEENYSFRPVETVRTYGEILGHIAAANIAMCSIVLGDKAPKLDRTLTSKADRIAALNTAFAYCDRAYEGMTDASGAQMVKFMGRDNPKLGVLSVMSVHTSEHYGNLITYMRMKGLVPPTSDPEFMKSLGASIE